MTGPAHSHATDRPGRFISATRLTAGAAAFLAVLAVAVAAIGWAAGWRAHVMTTPSMGAAAPVGTVVVSRPVSIDRLAVGDIISFHPPGRLETTFTHRIVAVIPGPGGTALRTKGDINPVADSWTLQQADLIGIVILAVPDAGFLLQALPLLLVGILLIALVTTSVGPRHRRSWRIAGGSALVGILLSRFHPLERVALLDQQVDPGGHGISTLVTTGVLPLRVSAVGGTDATIAPGHVGTVRLDHLRPGGAFEIRTAVHLTGWWWLVLLAWAAPLLLSLTVPRSAPTGLHRHGTDPTTA